MIFKRVFLTLLFLVCSALARAQPSAAPKEEEPIEFRAIAWNREIPDLFYEIKDKEQPLPLRRRTITEPQRYVGAPTLVFYAPTLVEGKIQKTPLVEVTLKRPPHKNLVVVWQETNGRYGATVLADEPESPPPGHVRFVNLSGQDLILKCNGIDSFPLPLGTEKTVPTNRGGLGVGVKVAKQIKGNWGLALTNGISVEPNERITAFIADPTRLAPAPENESNKGNIEVELLSLFLIRDRVSPAK